MNDAYLQGRCKSAFKLQLLLLYHFNRSIGNRLFANDSADYLTDKPETTIRAL